MFLTSFSDILNTFFFFLKISFILLFYGICDTATYDNIWYKLTHSALVSTA